PRPPVAARVAGYRRVAGARCTPAARRVVPGAHSRRRSPEEQVPAVNYRLEGEVAVLTIANPPVNALSLAVREGLLQGLQRAEQDRAVRSVVVTGADGTFAAGADINEVASGLVLKSPITREVQAKMEAGTKPIVAATEGGALGGGFGVALACHWRGGAAAARGG